MTKTCLVCGQEYQRKAFRLDSGACPTCQPPGLSLTWHSGPATTRTIWQAVLGFHLIYLFLSSVILCSEARILTLYSLIMVIYSGLKMAIGAVRGHPTLTREHTRSPCCCCRSGGRS